MQSYPGQLDRAGEAQESYSQEQSLKFDADKVPYHLIDPLFMESTAHVLDYGRKKYDEWNWARGTFEWSRLYRAALGHLTAWYGGEDFDPETGLPHLWHANCCLMFLTRYTYEGLGRDDRPRFPYSEFRYANNNNGPCRPDWAKARQVQAESLAKYHALKAATDAMAGAMADVARNPADKPPAGSLLRPSMLKPEPINIEE